MNYPSFGNQTIKNPKQENLVYQNVYTPQDTLHEKNTQQLDKDGCISGNIYDITISYTFSPYFSKEKKHTDVRWLNKFQKYLPNFPSYYVDPR